MTKAFTELMETMAENGWTIEWKHSTIMPVGMETVKVTAFARFVKDDKSFDFSAVAYNTAEMREKVNEFLQKMGY